MGLFELIGALIQLNNKNLLLVSVISAIQTRDTRISSESFPDLEKRESVEMRRGSLEVSCIVKNKVLKTSICVQGLVWETASVPRF